MSDELSELEWLQFYCDECDTNFAVEDFKDSMLAALRDGWTPRCPANDCEGPANVHWRKAVSA